RLAGKRNTQPQRIQLCSDFPQPFDMARRNEQPQRRKLLTQAQKNRSQNFLFTTMRATAEQYGAIRSPNRRRVPQRRGYGLAFCLNVGIVFDAAGALDAAALYA